MNMMSMMMERREPSCPRLETNTLRGAVIGRICTVAGPITDICAAQTFPDRNAAKKANNSKAHGQSTENLNEEDEEHLLPLDFATPKREIPPQGDDGPPPTLNQTFSPETALVRRSRQDLADNDAATPEVGKKQPDNEHGEGKNEEDGENLNSDLHQQLPQDHPMYKALTWLLGFITKDLDVARDPDRRRLRSGWLSIPPSKSRATARKSMRTSSGGHRGPPSDDAKVSNSVEVQWNAKLIDVFERNLNWTVIALTSLDDVYGVQAAAFVFDHALRSTVNDCLPHLVSAVLTYCLQYDDNIPPQRIDKPTAADLVQSHALSFPKTERNTLQLCALLDQIVQGHGTIGAGRIGNRFSLSSSSPLMAGSSSSSSAFPMHHRTAVGACGRTVQGTSRGLTSLCPADPSIEDTVFQDFVQQPVYIEDAMERYGNALSWALRCPRVVVIGTNKAVVEEWLRGIALLIPEYRRPRCFLQSREVPPGGHALILPTMALQGLDYTPRGRHRKNTTTTGSTSISSAMFDLGPTSARTADSHGSGGGTHNEDFDTGPSIPPAANSSSSAPSVKEHYSSENTSSNANLMSSSPGIVQPHRTSNSASGIVEDICVTAFQRWRELSEFAVSIIDTDDVNGDRTQAYPKDSCNEKWEADSVHMSGNVFDLLTILCMISQRPGITEEHRVQLITDAIVLWREKIAARLIAIRVAVESGDTRCFWREAKTKTAKKYSLIVPDYVLLSGLEADVRSQAFRMWNDLFTQDQQREKFSL